MAVGGFGGSGEAAGGGRIAVLGEGVQRGIPGRLHALGLELGAEAVARVAVGEQDGEEEVGGELDRVLVPGELEPGHLGEPLAVGANERAPGGDVLFEARQTAERQAQRGARRGGS